jgi:hypothetical protein
MGESAPYVGAIVHYVLPESIGRSGGQHRPAIVVRVWDPSDVNSTLQLQVFYDGSNDGIGDRPPIRWETSVRRDDRYGERTWHWNED